MIPTEKSLKSLLLGRKFLLATYSIVSASILAAFSKLTGDYVTVVSIINAAFATADTLITRKSMETT